ncbi:sensor histidine kinase [Phaeacidiphilus oryzae]|uniref:sensor histidine kinase n=1 Tax=Phaeacidiphilus oryzae TaxID=348818 RepID=UPI000569A1A8|nr:ATP-binding protein [Phaeacidiphilus oryzae]
MSRRRRSVRLTLTAVYGGLFFAAGAGLLALVYLLCRQSIVQHARMTVVDTVGGSTVGARSVNVTVVPKSAFPGRSAASLTADQIRDLALRLSSTTLHQLLLDSAVALSVALGLSVLLAWWISGRVLRPLHRITETARRLSWENLHERIALDGPEDELRALADTFDDMLDRLHTAFDSQRRFIAHASHELRTPLAVQRAAIQIRLGRAAPEDIPQVQRELLDANRRSERLIEGLLMLAGGDRGLTTRSRLDLAEVLRDAVEQCRSVAAACGLALRAETAVPAPVNGDRVLLTQLALNLLHNAIRYNIPGGQVHASVSSGGVLTVSNTGPVVPADRVAELFEPFRRLGPRSEPSGPAAELGFSAGLGLSIVRSIATAHGGTVTAEPGPLGGLTVRATLPAAGAVEPARPTRTEIRV